MPLLIWVLILTLITGCTTKQSTTNQQPSLPDADKPASAPASNAANNSHSANGTSQAPAHYVFDNQAAKLGIDFTYRNGEQAQLFSIVESLGGGVAIFDFDGDGRNDLLFPGGGTFTPDGATPGLPTGLYWNRNGSFLPAAVSSRIDQSPSYSHGADIGDFDNDGFSDVMLSGYNQLILFRNQGDGTFEARQPFGTGFDPKWTTSLAWGDFTGDGNLDLYAARYVDWSFQNNPACFSSQDGPRDICPPKSFAPLPDLLLVSDGEGGFRDESHSFSLDSGGKGLGVLAADFNNDSALDLYVANDTTNNFLYLNQQGQKLQEVGLLHGAAVDERGLPNGSMGVAAADYDRDGWLDLWVTNYERESFAFYRNAGEAQFIHFSRRLGATVLGGSYVGFGTELLDLDNDGIAEIVVANGHVILHPTAAPYRQTPLLMSFREGRFRPEKFSPDNYFGQEHLGRGLAVGELNGDDRPDIAISHVNEPVAVLINHTPTENKTLVVRLIGTAGNRDAIGARVIIEQGDQLSTYQLIGGGSYLSRSERVIRCPWLDGNSMAKISVFWPYQTSPQVVEVASSQQSFTLVQPGK